MGRPDEAAHVIGKLLATFGEDRILWGTDCIWFGSPQDQIQAFRAFEITPEYQDKFGYPALTAEIKRKIFGLNAARVTASMFRRSAPAASTRRAELMPSARTRASRPTGRPTGSNSWPCISGRRPAGLRCQLDSS